LDCYPKRLTIFHLILIDITGNGKIRGRASKDKGGSIANGGAAVDEKGRRFDEENAIGDIEASNLIAAAREGH